MVPWMTGIIDNCCHGQCVLRRMVSWVKRPRTMEDTNNMVSYDGAAEDDVAGNVVTVMSSSKWEEGLT